MPNFLQLVIRSTLIVLMLVTTVYLVRAFDARRMPDLGPEYRIRFEHEFAASAEQETDWNSYLAIEAALAAELDEHIDSSARTDRLFDRYSEDSVTFPGNFGGNWNQSYELSAPAARGVAVLLHGLSDSPYSMLPTAQLLASAGYNVVVPRMPGHGFAVGGLLQARWEDWTAVVRIAIRHAMTRPGAGESLLLVGYSNGGLMAVDYALRCASDEATPCPDRLVLLSPAIAVSSVAIVANWHAAISWLPWFEKFKWLSILPEIDPFKFTSFTKRAGWEIYKISSRVHRMLRDPERVNSLPPILTFQSVVDNTVRSEAVVNNLYSKLPQNGSRLIVYDVNRNSSVVHLMRKIPGDPLAYFESHAPHAYDLTILRNRNDFTLDIDAIRIAAGEAEKSVEQTDLSWPPSFYSLSHIAIPFPPDDLLYGNGANRSDSDPGIAFGNLAPRGELGVLLLSSDYFLRSRYNPFYRLQSQIMRDWLRN